MNRILASLIITVALSYLTLGQEQSKSPAPGAAAASRQSGQSRRAELALRQIETEILEILVKGDTAALDRIWADEYRFTAPDGRIVDKATYLALLQSGSLKYESLKLEDVKIHVYGDTAVAAGRVTVKGRIGTHDIIGQDRFLTVYVKRQGRWQQVATQAARINKVERVQGV